MRKGLFVGIDHYENVSPLNGCVSDATEMSEVLSRHANGEPNFRSKLLISKGRNLCGKSLKNSVTELFSGDCEVALLYFAGHGHFDNNLEEGMLIPQDYQDESDGIRVSDILKYASDAKGIKNKIIILDCCESGGAGDSNQLRGGASIIHEGVTILTACKKTEAAMEQDGHGVFTNLLIQALNGGAANVLGHITPGSLYSFIDGALGPWEQRPIFKTNVSQFTSVKKVSPLVPLETLRKLPDWFPEPDSKYPLDPSYEPKEKEHFVKENGEIFKQLQKCNRHSLIEPVDEEHMYFAAINSKGCKLTSLGEYYRELAQKGHF